MNAPITIDNSTNSAPPAITLDERTYARGLACVHCGLCLPACPTYTQTWNEADSPRGRIQLMLALADGEIQPTESVCRHLDQCLDCRACETICPSGVVYHELIEESRPKLEPLQAPTLQSRLLRWVSFHILTHPSRLKLALIPARIIRRLGLAQLLPKTLRTMVLMAPASGPMFPKPLPPLTRSIAPERNKVRVALLPTCVGSVTYDHVNRCAIDLLAACGADVNVSSTPLCCGAVHHHNGAPQAAQEIARRTIDAILPVGGPAPDFITTAVAGCGAMLKDYPFIFRDDPEYRDRAAEFSSRVRDISELLLELGLPEPKHMVNESVTYHDACHLAHAQQVTSAPRKLLMKIPGLKLISLPESDTCCGAAGTYNLTQPEMATQLAQRKLRNIATTGCSIVAAGNVGCAMHIKAQAELCGQDVTIVHPVELLHRAMFGEAGL
jgi:glycolate oxidase iron-sulfur subunit